VGPTRRSGNCSASTAPPRSISDDGLRPDYDAFQLAFELDRNKGPDD